jgi:hypothetical protein
MTYPFLTQEEIMREVIKKIDIRLKLFALLAAVISYLYHEPF